MELDEAMRTQHACRYYRDDPVPDEVLFRAVELARFAPNGGNRCAVRFVFVRDASLRRQLGEWYLPLWEKVAAAARKGAEAIPGAGGQPRSVQTGFSDTARTMADTDQFARRFGEHPVIIVVCADRFPGGIPARVRAHPRQAWLPWSNDEDDDDERAAEDADGRSLPA
jgi:nitroreductase